MKSNDSDLIDKLNALSAGDLSDLLEFLGVGAMSGDHSAQLLDSLRAALSQHRRDGGKARK